MLIWYEIHFMLVFSEKLKGFTSGLKFNEFFLNLMMGDGPNLFLVLASLPLDIVDISKLIPPKFYTTALLKTM